MNHLIARVKTFSLDFPASLTICFIHPKERSKKKINLGFSAYKRYHHPQANKALQNPSWDFQRGPKIEMVMKWLLLPSRQSSFPWLPNGSTGSFFEVNGGGVSFFSPSSHPGRFSFSWHVVILQQPAVRTAEVLAPTVGIYLNYYKSLKLCTASSVGWENSQTRSNWKEGNF